MIFTDLQFLYLILLTRLRQFFATNFLIRFRTRKYTGISQSVSRINSRKEDRVYLTGRTLEKPEHDRTGQNSSTVNQTPNRRRIGGMLSRISAGIERINNGLPSSLLCL
jgi:hypothetical protein